MVVIAAGSDERLGIAPSLPDRFPAPSAMSYWTQQRWLTGGETLAYMIHHFLRHRLVIPIPDIWMIGIAVILYFYWTRSLASIVRLCDYFLNFDLITKSYSLGF